MSAPLITVLSSSAAARPQWRNCGGGRRAAQIAEILARGAVEALSSDEIAAPRFSRTQLLGAALRLRLCKPVIKFRADRNIIRHLASDYLRHRWFFANHPHIHVLLIENCTDYAQIRAAQDAGVRIVGLPHNFEVWQQDDPRDFYSGEGMPDSLHREALFASLCDEAFCISREEQWFLANYGAKADFLPYYPPKDELVRLQAIREAREGAPPSGLEFFAVTACSNRRNREGLAALAEIVARMPADRDFHLHVGGFQSRELQPLFPAERCTFHGELAPDRLDDLMRRCKGAIVYQRSGVGALTRIPELLCAGIPVLANPHAARSAQHLPGVKLFHDGAELLDRARSALAVPPMHGPDRAAEERLLACITHLAAGLPHHFA